MADLNLLSTSLRHMQQDLRQPSGFRDVFEVPGHPDLLMRVNGEVYAVFPRSEYALVQSGIMPLIPANTVFYIGAPPSIPDSALAMARRNTSSPNEQSNHSSGAVIPARQRGEIDTTPAGQRANTRDTARAHDSTPPIRVDPDAPDTKMMFDVEGPVTIVTDHSYRLWRLQELLQRAAKAEQAKASAPNNRQ